MRAALYVRISTREQTADNQERELRAVAARMGHEMVEVYAITASAAPRAVTRPAFDQLYGDATRRKFDLMMAWSVSGSGARCGTLSPS